MISMGTDILKTVINLISGETNQVFSYADKDDFEKLWTLVFDFDSNKPLIVIDTGFPSSDKKDSDDNFSTWVSSLAWAVTFSCHLKQQEKNMPIVHILNLSSLKTNVWQQELVYGSFIRFYSPEKDKGCDFLKAFVDGILKEPNADTDTNKESPAFKEFWNKLCQNAAKVSDGPESNHNVSNQIGALLLCAAISNPTDDEWDFTKDKLFHSAAAQMVWTLTRSLFPSTKVFCPFFQKAGAGGSLSSAFFPQEKKVKVVLVDDRHDEGYAWFLTKALGDGAEVTSRKGVFEDGTQYDHEISDPKNVLGTELNFPSDPPRIFSDMDVLFLDLRLWKPNDDNKEKTLKKYKELAKKILENLPESDKKTPACDRLGALLKDSCENGENPNSYKDLAILPLMLTVIDPALPIILFSSTQHRSVIQAVRDCPNVITDFSKPYLGGPDRDASDPGILLKDLEVAVNRALKMVEIRQVWRKAVTQWNGQSLKELNWSDNWPKMEENDLKNHHPLIWLRTQWLPLAQQGHYALAATLPWSYLRSVLGDTRLAILAKDLLHSDGHSDIVTTDLHSSAKNCLKLIYATYHSFPLQLKTVKETEIPRIERELAIAAGFAFVQLIKDWTTKPCPSA